MGGPSRIGGSLFGGSLNRRRGNYRDSEFREQFSRLHAEHFPDETVESLTVSSDLERSLSLYRAQPARWLESLVREEVTGSGRPAIIELCTLSHRRCASIRQRMNF